MNPRPFYAKSAIEYESYMNFIFYFFFFLTMQLEDADGARTNHGCQQCRCCCLRRTLSRIEPPRKHVWVVAGTKCVQLPQEHWCSWKTHIVQDMAPTQTSVGCGMDEVRTPDPRTPSPSPSVHLAPFLAEALFFLDYPCDSSSLSAFLYTSHTQLGKHNS